LQLDTEKQGFQTWELSAVRDSQSQCLSSSGKRQRCFDSDRQEVAFITHFKNTYHSIFQPRKLRVQIMLNPGL